MIEIVKRIGIDARFLLRPLRGMPLYVLNLCQQLPVHVKEYQFYYFINKGYEHNDIPDNYLPRIKGIIRQHPNVTFVNHDCDGEIMWEQVYLPRMLKQHQIDLVHMPGNRVCFFPGIPMVVTVHDVIEYIFLKQRYINWIAKEKKLWNVAYHTRIFLYRLALYWIGMRKAEKIITVSNHSASDIVSRLNIERNRIHVVYHGVDNAYLNHEIIPFEQRRFVLMLGGDSEQKNPEFALAAWKKVDPKVRRAYPLKIVGFCGNTDSELVKSVQKYELGNHIQISGWVSLEKMVWYFRHAALFLFPSMYEGFGFPLIQAMACGTPVVSSDRASIPEILGPAGKKYKLEDVSGMARGIERLLTVQREWQRQSESGYDRARSFMWEHTAQKHLKIYESLL